MRCSAATVLLLAASAASSPAAKQQKKYIPLHPTVTPNIKGLPFETVARASFTPSVRIPGYKTVENCGPVFGNKIVGGEQATPHEFPWQVGMFIDDMYFCGGSIISPEWVLTAAHCTSGHRSVEVIAGAQYIYGSEASQVRQVSTDFFEHPDWNPYLLNNDLALIHLSTPLELTDAIAPVCLPSRSSPALKEGDMVTASGWGKVNDDIFGSISDVLNKVTLPILNHAECAAYYGDAVVTENVVCMDTTGGHGVCSGDSGGPLTWVENGKTVTRGITSFGPRAGCLSGYPDGDTRVKNYLDWIESSTGIIVDN